MGAEYKIASTKDLAKGQMREFELPGEKDEKVLLANVNDQYYATSPKCTHYGAPLVNGGDIEDAPAWDALMSYKTHVRGTDIFITVPEASALKQGRRVPASAPQSSLSDEHVVIVGGGASGFSAAQCLREYGFTGKVSLISEENYAPVDRTKISKALITDASKIAIRDEQGIKSLGIDFQKGTAITSIDTKNKSVHLSHGKSLPYTKLILASGGKAKRLPLPNFDLSNVFVVRQVPDAEKIVSAASGGRKKVVIVGSSFIGMEAAGALAKDHDVTVVGMEKQPLERVLGEQVGRVVRGLHEKNGVKFKLGAGIAGATSSDSKTVDSVELEGGEEIPTDLVILGVGIAPATEYLKDNASFKLQKDGSLEVDGYMRVKGVEDVYAIGDIATFPYPQLSVSLRIEHWDVAMNHGRTAANHIAKGSKAEQYDATLYFWSAQGSQLRYCGTTAPPVGFDDILIQGDLDKVAFAAFYCKVDEVVAVASMGYDPAVSLSAVLMRQRRMPTKTQLKLKDIKTFAA